MPFFPSTRDIAFAVEEKEANLVLKSDSSHVSFRGNKALAGLLAAAANASTVLLKLDGQLILSAI